MIPVKKILSKGYETIYNVSYSHPTNYNELLKIKELCSSDSNICVGASNQNEPGIVSLISCGNCISILKNTKINHPIKINHAYWYLTKFYSFGFSPSFFINQNDCDKHDCDENNICQDNRRLCWYIGGLTGGWRIGKFVSLYSEVALTRIVRDGKNMIRVRLYDLDEIFFKIIILINFF